LERLWRATLTPESTINGENKWITTGSSTTRRPCRESSAGSKLMGRLQKKA